MKMESIAIQWQQSSNVVMLEDALSLVEEAGCFIAVNDGTNLTIGVELS